MTRKNLILLLLILIIVFIGFNLYSLFQRENPKDISFSDFRSSIGPASTFIAVFLSYRAEIKKEKHNNTSI
ncbi:hypothetical protein FF52_09833 [Flavobacterium sp. F52]|nr:hypothetical protein FF52_09833 [Flavobacterium sp. F52]